MPVDSHVLDGRGPAAATDVEGEALGVERVVGQKGQLLLLHGSTPPAINPPDLQVQVNPGVAAGLVPNAPDLAVVPSGLDAAATPAGRFFSRRSRVMIRALGSPKTPLIAGPRRKPGNRYSSKSFRFLPGEHMDISYRFSRRAQERRNPYSMRPRTRLNPLFYPLAFTKTLSFYYKRF